MTDIALALEILTAHFYTQAEPAKPVNRIIEMFAPDLPPKSIKQSLNKIFGDVLLGNLDDMHTAFLIAEGIGIMSATQGRAPAYAIVAAFVQMGIDSVKGYTACFHPSVDVPSKQIERYRNMFTTTLGLLASKTQDEGLLRDVATLIRESLPELDTVAKILDAADLHIQVSNNPDDKEATGKFMRVDPDIRMVIEGMRGKIPIIERADFLSQLPRADGRAPS